MAFNDYLRDAIGSALKSSVWSLHCRSDKYGTGFDIKIEDHVDGKEVTLLLMSGPSSEYNVIEELKATTSLDSKYGFVDEITTKFQNQLFAMRP
jgi:hypothetical protein